MLIICNGAYKSGSSWLFNIVRTTLVDHQIIPDQYLNPNWKNPSILKEKLKMFIVNEDIQNQHFISKNHFQDQEIKTYIADKKNIKLLNIKREEKDMLVSAYYHEINFLNYKGSFEDFYFDVGIKILKRVRKHHKVWNANPASNFYCISYEELKSNFEQELKKLIDFIGLNEERDLDTILKQNSFEFRKSKSPSNLFLRKGIVGDWKNHFNESLLLHYNNLKI